MSFKSLFEALEDAGDSRLGFGILILIWIWSLVFDTPIFQNSAPYLDFEGAKNIHVLQVMIWIFGGCWWVLTGGLHPDIDLNMFIGLWLNHNPNFCSLSSFLRCKEHPCPLSPDMGLWRMLEVSYWGLVSWSLFRYNHWSLIYQWSQFWPSTLILKVQRTSMSFKSPFVALEDAGGPWLGFDTLILILIWSLVFDMPMIPFLALYLDFKGAKNIHVL